MPVSAEVIPAPEGAPVESPDTAGTDRWRTWLLLLVGIELAVLFAPTVRWLIDRWTMSVWHNAHGLFILPLVAWLSWQELKARPDLPRSSSAWGFVLVIPALALHALDAGIHTQLLSAFAFVLMLPGLSLLFLGVPRTRLILFPLLFSLFALPIPLGLTETIHLVLRKVTVAVATVVLPLLGISVYTEGTTLHTVHGALEVADACSGFSTLYAAMAVAFLTAYTASGRWRRALVLLAAPPIAIASNVLRVVLLVALVAWRGQGILETPLHPLSGMMTFALSLPIVFWLGGSKPAKAAA
jgi:exosortase